jgi:hypothetical protein
MTRHVPSSYPTLLALAIVLLASACSRKTDEDYPWPVWILYVTTVEPVGFSGVRVPVEGCPSATWWYQNDAARSNENCYEGQGNVVKVWRPLTEEVRISYIVHCSGYYDSETNSAYFLPPASQGPGREGEEVIASETVVLRRR